MPSSLLVTLRPLLSAPQILVANDKACQLLGHSSHALIGQRLTQFFLKPDSDVAKALSEEHVEADGRAAVVFGTVVSAGLLGCAAGASLCAGVGGGAWPWAGAGRAQGAAGLLWSYARHP